MANRHIALPKSSLNRFSSNGICYCLDLKSLKITKEKSDNFNTYPDYYSQEIDDYLSKEVETKLGRLNKLINDFYELKSSITFLDLKKDIVSAVVIQWLRNPNSKYNIRGNSFFGQQKIFSDMFYSPLHNPLVCDKVINDCIKLYEKYEPVLMLIDKERCSGSFVLPTNHYINYESGSVIFFISPYSAFLIAREDLLKSTKYICLTSYDELKPIIDITIVDEKNYGLGRLIGFKDQLLKIVNLS